MTLCLKLWKFLEMDNILLKEILNLLKKITNNDYLIGDIGNGSFVNQGNGDQINYITDLIVHPPKQIKLKAITNLGRVLIFIGILLSICFYGYVMNITSYFTGKIFFGYSADIIIYLLTFMIVSLFSVGMMSLTELLSFYFNSFHIVYEKGKIQYAGRERKFYDEIWDIKLGNFFTKKVIYCYGVNSDAMKQIYCLKLYFSDESEAKYIHDIFHAGKCPQRKNMDIESIKDELKS